MGVGEWARRTRLTSRFPPRPNDIFGPCCPEPLSKTWTMSWRLVSKQNPLQYGKQNTLPSHKSIAVSHLSTLYYIGLITSGL